LFVCLMFLNLYRRTLAKKWWSLEQSCNATMKCRRIPGSSPRLALSVLRLSLRASQSGATGRRKLRDSQDKQWKTSGPFVEHLLDVEPIAGPWAGCIFVRRYGAATSASGLRFRCGEIEHFYREAAPASPAGASPAAGGPHSQADPEHLGLPPPSPPRPNCVFCRGPFGAPLLPEAHRQEHSIGPDRPTTSRDHGPPRGWCEARGLSPQAAGRWRPRGPGLRPRAAGGRGQPAEHHREGWSGCGPPKATAPQRHHPPPPTGWSRGDTSRSSRRPPIPLPTPPPYPRHPGAARAPELAPGPQRPVKPQRFFSQAAASLRRKRWVLPSVPITYGTGGSAARRAFCTVW